MPPAMPDRIWNWVFNVIVFPSAAGANHRLFDWHAPEIHAWFRTVFPSEGYDGPEWEVWTPVSARFPPPSRTHCDGRYHSASFWAMNRHREYTHHFGVRRGTSGAVEIIAVHQPGQGVARAGGPLPAVAVGVAGADGERVRRAVGQPGHPRLQCRCPLRW